MADLERLLDQVTPYFKARIEDYHTAQQRAVIDAIALHWDPITVGELSRVTGVASTTLSPLLIKLRNDGLIETVETSRPVAGHQMVERLLNIWYLMRHGTRRAKQKMRWLVKFLAVFYSPPELDGLIAIARRPERSSAGTLSIDSPLKRRDDRLGRIASVATSGQHIASYCQSNRAKINWTFSHPKASWSQKHTSIY